MKDWKCTYVDVSLNRFKCVSFGDNYSRKKKTILERVVFWEARARRVSGTYVVVVLPLPFQVAVARVMVVLEKRC